jgi:hypothetical protein
MKKKTRKISGIFLCLLMVAMVFAVAVPMNIGAGSPKANTQVPFEGTFDGSTVPRVDPDLERYEVSGQANQLGKFTVVMEADLDLISIYDVVEYPILWLATLTFTTVTFTAANGDELYVDLLLDGVLNAVDQNFPSFTLSATITGGTGRFVGASGSFTGSGGQTSVLGDDNDLVSGAFAGTISTVGSNK